MELEAALAEAEQQLREILEPPTISDLKDAGAPLRNARQQFRRRNMKSHKLISELRSDVHKVDPGAMNVVHLLAHLQ